LKLAGDDFAGILSTFAEVERSGDKHAVKAWRDVAPAIMDAGRDWQQAERNQVLEALENAGTVLMSEEEYKFDAERKEKRAHLAELAQVAKDIDTQRGGTPYTLKEVLDGIDPNAPQLVQSETGEKPGDYITRRASETELSAAEKATAYKLGVSELDYARSK